ncbi:MAG: RDD family protein [Nitrososphaerota archaeon]|nr:RDD family protein [Nitrososphaerota archaeon]MDG7024131.1 RDD family protein [Nitrososphaerota archaeon]
MAFCAKCGKEIPEGAAFCPSCGAPSGGTAAASSGPMSGIDTLTKDQKAQEYWIWRLVAIIVDWIAVYIVLGIIIVLVALPAFLLTAGGALVAGVVGPLAVLWGIVFVLYFAVTESMWGASLGKRLFNLKVKSKSGSNPTFGEAFVRNVSKIYWLLLLLDVIVGLALSKGYQQKYSDHLMGTTVVRG